MSGDALTKWLDRVEEVTIDLLHQYGVEPVKRGSADLEARLEKLYDALDRLPKPDNQALPGIYRGQLAEQPRSGDVQNPKIGPKFAAYLYCRLAAVCRTVGEKLPAQLAPANSELGGVQLATWLQEMLGRDRKSVV